MQQPFPPPQKSSERSEGPQSQPNGIETDDHDYLVWPDISHLCEWRRNLTRNHKVSVLWCANGGKYDATVHRVSKNRNWVYLRWDGYDKKWDEWLPLTSTRILHKLDNNRNIMYPHGGRYCEVCESIQAEVRFAIAYVRDYTINGIVEAINNNDKTLIHVVVKNVEPTDAQRVFEALLNNNVVRKLDCAYSNIGTRGMLSLVELFEQNTSIEEFALMYDHSVSEGCHAKLLRAISKSKTLKSFYYRLDPVTHNLAMCVGDVLLKNTSLVMIDISYTSIADAELISDCYIHNTTLLHCVLRLKYGGRPLFHSESHTVTGKRNETLTFTNLGVHGRENVEQKYSDLLIELTDASEKIDFVPTDIANLISRDLMRVKKVGDVPICKWLLDFHSEAISQLGEYDDEYDDDEY